jgi:hypothetical protein
MTGLKESLVGKEMSKKLGSKSDSCHCIIHQESLFCNITKLEHIIKRVVSIFNFSRAQRLYSYHQQFAFFPPWY